MKKPVLFAMLSLSLGLAACGKGNDAAVVANPNGVIAVSAPPFTPPAQPGMTLQQWCSMYSYQGFQMSGSYCTVTQQFPGNYGTVAAITIGGNYGPFPASQSLYGISGGQRVSISSYSNTKLYLGNTYVGTGSFAFVASTSGQLSFYVSNGVGTAGVQSLSVTSCYSAPAQAVACP